MITKIDNEKPQIPYFNELPEFAKTTVLNKAETTFVN